MNKTLVTSMIIAASAAYSEAAPTVHVRVPERFRLLTGQLYDLRVEATGLTAADLNNTSLVIRVNGLDVTASLPAPQVTTNNDTNAADLDKAWTFRAINFPTAGIKTVVAEVTDDSGPGSQTRRIGVQPFAFTDAKGRNIGKKNIILFIGDAMGTAYRDAGRIVAKSTVDGSGEHFREGFFDSLQSMDTMPFTGMSMTYSSENIVPDSANTATAWATGNKTVNGTVGVFTDNTDAKYAFNQATKANALDNPRVETLWEYLKRNYGYKTGIVSTADMTDATPAGEGGHSFDRGLGYDIAKQYVDGTFVNAPTFDVILGGGKERFETRTSSNSGDIRNLTNELVANFGFTNVGTRTALNALPSGASAPDKLVGFFRTSNMNVAYDKLALSRPTDEPAPNFGGFTDQPFLDEMTAKAIATLSKGGAPFILMVEGASIDKQSHPNHAAGVIWDTIEFDKSVAVGRAFANGSGPNTKTLVVVTADHDQSMHITGCVDTNTANFVTNTRSNSVYPRTIAPYDSGSGVPAPSNSGSNSEVGRFPDYVDSNGDGYPENGNRYQISVGFRTGNHTGSSVPCTADGPGGLLFVGYYDQTDIFFKMAKTLSRETSALDEVGKTLGKFSTINQNY
jgi:alkaline phosphatase